MSVWCTFTFHFVYKQSVSVFVKWGNLCTIDWVVCISFILYTSIAGIVSLTRSYVVFACFVCVLIWWTGVPIHTVPFFVIVYWFLVLFHDIYVICTVDFDQDCRTSSLFIRSWHTSAQSEQRKLPEYQKHLHALLFNQNYWQTSRKANSLHELLLPFTYSWCFNRR